MHCIKKSVHAALVGTLLVPAVMFAALPFSVDTADFDAGIVKEGEHSLSVKHTFHMKNTGAAPLIIANVRAGCGCTTVGFDSIIPPGKIGAITAEVHAEGFPEGQFNKGVTVEFGGGKLMPFHLTVRGIKKQIVSLEPNTIQVPTGKGRDTGAVILIKTEKKKFAVTGITFSSGQSDLQMAWQSIIPLKFSFSLVPDSGKPKQVALKTPWTKKKPLPESSLLTYRLRITASLSEKESRWGEFVIKTNLPEKPEIKLSGSLQP